MTDKPQPQKHDDRTESRTEPRAAATSFDNGLTTPSSNDTLKRKMSLPSNEEAVDSTPHLQIAVAADPVVAPAGDNKVVPPIAAPATLSRVSSTGDVTGTATAAANTGAAEFSAVAALKPALPGALPAADAGLPKDGKLPATFSPLTSVDTLTTDKGGPKLVSSASETDSKFFTATTAINGKLTVPTETGNKFVVSSDSGGFFSKFVELGTKVPKGMDDGPPKGGSAREITKVVDLAVNDILTATKRVKLASDDAHPEHDRKPAKDRDGGSDKGGFLSSIFNPDKPGGRKRRDDDDDGAGNGRKRRKDNDDDNQHPKRKVDDNDNNNNGRRRKPDDADGNNGGRKHKDDDDKGRKHVELPAAKPPQAPPPADVKPPVVKGRPGAGGGDGHGDGDGGGHGGGRRSAALKEFHNNLDRLGGGLSGKDGADPGEKHGAGGKTSGSSIARGLSTLGQGSSQHGGADAKRAVTTANAHGLEHQNHLKNDRENTRVTAAGEHGTANGGRRTELKLPVARTETGNDNRHGGGELRTRHGMDAQKVAQLPDLRTALRPDSHRSGEHVTGQGRNAGERTAHADAVQRGGMPHEGRVAPHAADARGTRDAVPPRVESRLDLLENTRRTLEPRQDPTTGREQPGGREQFGGARGRNGESTDFTVRSTERGAPRPVAPETPGGRPHGERTENANKTDRNNSEGGDGAPGDRLVAGRVNAVPVSPEDEEARRKNRRLLQQQEGDATQFVPEETRTPDEEEIPVSVHIQHAVRPVERSDEEEETKEEELESAASQDEQRQRALAILAAANNNDPSQQQSQQQQNQQGSNSGANGGGTIVDPDAVLPTVEIVGTHDHLDHHPQTTEVSQTISAPHPHSGTHGASPAVLVAHGAVDLGDTSPADQGVLLPQPLAHAELDHNHSAHANANANANANAGEPTGIAGDASGNNPYSNPYANAYATDSGANVATSAIADVSSNLNSGAAQYDVPTYPQADSQPLSSNAVDAIVADSSNYVESVTEELPAYQQEDWQVAGAFGVEQRRDVEISAYEDHNAAMKAMRDAELDAYDLHDKQLKEDRDRLDAERKDRELREAEREERERREEEARVRRQRELDEYQRKLILLNNQRNKGNEYPDMPRVKYSIQKGDTLESIATRRLRDKRLAQLIYELNKRSIPARQDFGKTFLTMVPGTALLLPNHQDIKMFYSTRRPAATVFGYDIAADKTTAADDSTATTLPPSAFASDGGARRANIEKLLGTIGNATTKPEATCVVRLGDSLNSLAKRVLKDASLWPLLAEINGLSTESDQDGKSTIRLQRGTTLILPEATQVAQYTRNLRGDSTVDEDATIDDAKTVVVGANRTMSTGELTAIARDVVDVTREYVFLREDVRLAVCVSKATGAEMHLGLEVDIAGQWTVVYSYEQRCADKWYRNKVDARGHVTRLPLDLPDRIAVELAQNDLYCDWETYATEYLDSLRVSLRA